MSDIVSFVGNILVCVFGVLNWLNLSVSGVGTLVARASLIDVENIPVSYTHLTLPTKA